MLGKLFKHEFKAQYKLYGAIYFAILLIGVVTCTLGFISDKFPNNIVVKSLYACSIFMAISALVVMFIMTMVISIYRYYTNLIKDQGYLMHTLPVPAFNHHIVKLILPFLWFVADAAVTFIMIILMTRDLKFEWFDIIRGLMDALEIDMSAGNIVMGLLYILISIVTSLSIFYACCNVGSLSNSNKGLMAFVAYIIFYIINQSVSSIGLFVFMGIMAVKSGIGIGEMLMADEPPAGYTNGSMVTGMVVSVIFIIFCNIVSRYVLTKKVNLE